MNDNCDILISIEDTHVQNILSGLKSVELRNRCMHIKPGTLAWIYSKYPCATIKTRAVIDSIAVTSPDQLWKLFGTQAAISKAYFDSYFSERDIGYALVLREVLPLKPILTLSYLQNSFPGFCPPQFYKRLPINGPHVKLFQTALV